MDLASLVQNIQLRCKLKGVFPTVACKDAGVGASFISDMKSGRTPSVAKVQKMADYLGCTVSDLLGEKKEPTTVSGDGQALKLEAALRDIGLDVEHLTEADIAKIAKLAKTLLEE